MKTKLLCLALAVGVSAYGSFLVAPGANTSANGDGFTVIPFSSGAWTFQWQIAASQLAPMAGDTVTSIGFRLATGASNVAAGASITNWDLELSPAANALGSLSTTFANNIGAGGVTVYDSSVTLPALTGGAGPNPFFLITFTTPYTYTSGDLLMTLVIPGGGPQLALDGNLVDANGDTAGQPGGGTAQAQFFNYPITEFGYTTATPEPATLGLCAAALLAFCGAKARRAFNR
jgi:hypothetical protein